MIATIFFANGFADEKPSANIMISAMSEKSGTIIETGLTIAFKLSGSSARPA